jgi:AGZA family xanthine/uracil permease-like MFS transporter
MTIERWFGCEERGSTWSTEVVAGLSTFLSLSYIFVVNPSILGEAGMPRRAVFFATIITSAAATLLMGLWANLPYVLAPGMEINAYIAFYAVAVLGLSWQQALGAVFWSGVLFLLFSISGIRQGIIDSLPDGLKRSLAAAVGMLLAAVALRVTGVLRYDGVTLSGFASIGKPAVVLLASTTMVFVLSAMRVRAAVLLSIIGGAGVAALLGNGAAESASTTGGDMIASIGAADLRVITEHGGWLVILVLFLVDFYGSIAKLVGLLVNTKLLCDGRVPRMREALLIDGAAATAGSMLGTTSVLVYAESGVGIAAGGRTGLTAVTAALAMLTCFAAAPFLRFVPVAATSGALLYVAYRLLPSIGDLRQSSIADVIQLVTMAGIVFATFSLDRALLIGLLFHVVLNWRKGVRLNAYSIGSVGLLLLGWIVS